MPQNTHRIFIALRDGSPDVQLLEASDFVAMSQGMIAEGFNNLHSEWFKSFGGPLASDHIITFVYWESPDSAPDYEQILKWGNDAARLNSETT